MSRKFSLILLLTLLLACKEKPKISRPAMVTLLTDCMLLEAGNQVQYNFATVPSYIWKSDYALVCKKHKVDTADFRQSMIYLEKHPEEFSQVLEEVITVLQKQETSKKLPTP